METDRTRMLLRAARTRQLRESGVLARWNTERLIREQGLVGGMISAARLGDGALLAFLRQHELDYDLAMELLREHENANPAAAQVADEMERGVHLPNGGFIGKASSGNKEYGSPGRWFFGLLALLVFCAVAYAAIVR